MTNVREKKKKHSHKDWQATQKDKTSQISSYEHKKLFSKNLTVHFGSHDDTVALPNGISTYIYIQHKWSKSIL